MRISTNLLFACLVLLLSLAGVRHANALAIVAKCGGNTVGLVSLAFTSGAKGSYDVTPSKDIAWAKDQCGADHFNWRQTIIETNIPFVVEGGGALTPPALDPPPGGMADSPATIGDDGQWADMLSYYWDESAPPAANTKSWKNGFLLANNLTNTSLLFEDFPSAGKDNSNNVILDKYIKFQTRLVSVSAEGNVNNIMATFYWDWIGPRLVPVAASANLALADSLSSCRDYAATRELGETYCGLAVFQAVPEPASIGMLAAGLFGTAFAYAWRRRSQAPNTRV